MSIPEVALTNLVPDLYTPAECQMLVDAAAAALPAFCKEWNIDLPTVAFYPDRSLVPATSWEIALLPAPAPGDANAGVEAFHEDVNGVPDGKCFAGFLLAQPGGNKWTGELAVSVAWTHEMFEALRNPRTNLVLQGPMTGPDNKVYQTVWAEVCDPAQGEHFVFTVGTQEIWTAGWVTQAWEDPNEKKGPYSMPAGIVPGPLRIGPQGYGGFGDGTGNTATVFAALCHPVIVALKTLHGRVAEMNHAANLATAGIPSAIPNVTFHPNGGVTVVLSWGTLVFDPAGVVTGAPAPAAPSPAVPFHGSPLTKCGNAAASCAHPLFEHAPGHGPLAPRKCLEPGCGCVSFVAPAVTAAAP